MHGHLSEADVKNHCYSGLARQRKSLDGFQTDSKYLPLYSFLSVIYHLKKLIQVHCRLEIVVVLEGVVEPSGNTTQVVFFTIHNTSF